MTDDKIKKQAIEINMLYKVNEEQEKEINRLKMIIDLKDDERIELVKENKELQGIIDDLQSDLVGATNDYKQSVNEVKLLNRQLDRQNTAVNDLADIVETSHKTIDALKEENKELKFRIKLLIKVHLNSIYGLCNVLDNTKETKDNDSNN